MARSFVNSSSEYLRTSSAPVTSAPLTMCVRYKLDNTSGNQTIFSVGNDSGADGEQFYMIQINGNVVRLGTKKVSSWAELRGATVSSGQWYHCAVVIKSTAGNAEIFTNGTSDRTSSSIQNPTLMNNISVGALISNGNLYDYADADVAEVSIWDVELNADEIATAAAGVSPLKIRPGDLQFYAPLWSSEDVDLIGGLSLTAYNTPTTAEHAPVVPFNVMPVFVDTPAAAAYQDAVASLSASANITSNAQRLASANASIQSNANMDLNAQRLASANASIQSNANISSIPSAILNAISSLSANANITSNAQRLASANASMQSNANMDLNVTRIRYAITSMQANSFLYAVSVRRVNAIASMQANASLSSIGQRLAVGAASLESVANLSPDAIRLANAVSQLQANANAISSAIGVKNATTQLPSYAYISSIGSIAGVVAGAAALEVNAYISASGLVIAAGVTSLGVNSYLSVSPTRIQNANTSLPAYAYIIADTLGGGFVYGVTSLQAIANLNASGVRLRGAASQLQASANTLSSAIRIQNAASQLQSNANITLDAIRIQNAIAQLQSNANITSSGILIASGDADLQAIASLSGVPYGVVLSYVYGAASLNAVALILAIGQFSEYVAEPIIPIHQDPEKNLQDRSDILILVKSADMDSDVRATQPDFGSTYPGDGDYSVDTPEDTDVHGVRKPRLLTRR